MTSCADRDVRGRHRAQQPAHRSCRSPDGSLQSATDLVARAHALGLLVHVWTLRSEPVFLSPSYHGDPGAEYRQFRDLGVDGIFTDFADAAVRALKVSSASTR